MASVMAAMTRRLLQFYRLPSDERTLFAEAYVALGIARLALLVVPGRWTTRWMGDRQRETSSEPGADVEATSRRVGLAIARASRHTPWASVCLPQALAAKAMLKRRGVPTTIYLGLSKTSDRAMAAHAWTRCGSVIVTGAREAAFHTRVASFADRSAADRP